MTWKNGQLTVDPVRFSKNIFQLWEEAGKPDRFKVRRWSWAETTYALIDKIVIQKYPYGKAWGTIYRRNHPPSEYHEISCSGCYQWEMVME